MLRKNLRENYVLYEYKCADTGKYIQSHTSWSLLNISTAKVTVYSNEIRLERLRFDLHSIDAAMSNCVHFCLQYTTAILPIEFLQFPEQIQTRISSKKFKFQFPAMANLHQIHFEF